MEFLSQQLRSPQANAVSLTKKAFKKPVGRYPSFTDDPIGSYNKLHNG